MEDLVLARPRFPGKCPVTQDSPLFPRKVSRFLGKYLDEMGGGACGWCWGGRGWVYRPGKFQMIPLGKFL